MAMTGERKILVTQDGSHTITLPAQGITYHSTYGAIQESRHVFIETGLLPLLQSKPTVEILEIGFGTGLNALLSLQQSILTNKLVHYTAIELYPLQAAEYTLLNYTNILNDEILRPLFLAMHKAAWDEVTAIHPLFTLHKIQAPVEGLALNNSFDVIYYDAFAPNDQPEIWTEDIFRQMFGLLNNNGVLVTYCSKGMVRRALRAAGFIVHKLPGPPGKREIVKAIKPG